MNIVIKNVQVGFLDKVLTKRTIPGTDNDPKYSATVILRKGEVPTELTVAINEAIAAKWPNGYPENARPVLRNDKKSWLPDGCCFFNMKTDYKPAVYWEPDGSEIEMPNDERLVSGRYCDVVVGVYAYSKAGNKGIGFSLDGLLVKDTPFEKVMGEGGVDAAALLGIKPATRTSNPTTTSDNTVPQGW